GIWTEAIWRCVVPILVAVFLGARLSPAFFYRDPSGKTIAQELLAANIPSSDLAVKQMSRGQRYSLSFYLREEIPEWDSNHPRNGYLLSANRLGLSQAGSALNYEEIPFNVERTGFRLYRIRLESVGGTPGSGEMKDAKA